MNSLKIEGNNTNAYELVQCICFLIDNNQWNDVAKFTASNSPNDFIKMVDDYRENGIPIKILNKEVDLWIHNHDSKQIYCIKLLRDIFGTGLIETKKFIELCPVKLVEGTTSSDFICFLIEKFTSCGIQIVLKNRDSSIGNIAHVCSYSSPRIEKGWVKNPAFKCPDINVIC